MNPRVSITSTVKVSRRRIRDSNGIPPTQKRKPLVAWFDGIEEQQMPSNPIVLLKEKEEKKNRTVSIQLQSNLLIFIVKHESEIQTKTHQRKPKPQ